VGQLNQMEEDSQAYQKPHPEITPIDSISFASGGWLFLYMFGVGKCLQDRGYISSQTKAAGCSAGALTAAGLCLNGDFTKATSYCKDNCVLRAYSTYDGIFKIGQYVSECLDISIDLSQCPNLFPGQLTVVYTILPFFKPGYATTFQHGHDLKQCLLASSAAWPFAPLVYHRDHWLVDGCYSVYQPTLGPGTITVSPLYFADADICPSRYVPIWWSLFPPSCEGTVDWLFELGYADASKWLDEREKNSSPLRAIELHTSSSPYPSTSSSALPFPSQTPVDHPYHIPKQLSIYRFLGYDIGRLTHSSIATFLNFLLFFYVNFFCRPIALLAIYSELYLLLFKWISGYLLLPIISTPFLRYLSYLFILFSPPLWIPSLVLTLLLRSHLTMMRDLSPSQRWISFLESLQCIFSLSLCLRYLHLFNTSIPAQPLKKEKLLLRLSFVYRLVRHFL
jgi:hypothetical protein